MSENSEKQKDELRDSLLTGAFGNELASFSDEEIIDEKFDDEVVATSTDEFMTNFGSHKQSDFIANIPSHILDSDYVGYLYGISREETESFYVIDFGQTNYPVIGYIANKNEPIPDDIAFGIIVTRNDDGFECKTTTSEQVGIKRYDEQVNLFSRNGGLLESGFMLDKCAIIIGCGSVGSFIAMQLARSGVGKFVLCDTDILEIHNICRHQCGFDDLGRYKVDAVRDKILNINPKADITVFRSVIQRIQMDVLLPFLGSNSIVIGTGDNRESSRYACDNLAIPTNTSFVTTCCWRRAFAGEVIYWTPGKNLPCYQCALGNLVDSDYDSENQGRDINYWGSRNAVEISRPFNIIINKNSKRSEATQAFIDFILSEEGQTIVANDCMPIGSDAPTYCGVQPSGTIKIEGSSLVTSVMQKLKEAYEAVNSNVTIELQTNDSTTGIIAAIEGNADIAMSSRNLKESELAKLDCIGFAIDLAFELGVAVDIDFVSLIAVKIILDLINKENPKYTSRVINYLTEYTWVCNTNEPRIGGEKAGIFSHPLQITHTLRFRKKDGCVICGDKD